MTNTRQFEWSGPAGVRHILHVAWPLVLSNAFWMAQISIDRILLSRDNPDAVGAAMMAAMLFWTPITLLQSTVNYATTFVAQYHGATRPERIGAAVWQALYLAVLGGFLFLLLLLVVDPLVAWMDHAPAMRELEANYLRCLCFAGMPFLVTAAVTSFFAGRGQSRAVLVINSVGLFSNALLAYAWIYGKFGLPAWGIVGAGWATVVCTWLSALVGLAWFLSSTNRQQFATLSGWRPDFVLCGRLLRFGLPNGVATSMEGVAFAFFLVFVGRLGKAELSATSIAFTLNMLVYMPCLGLGQAVGILVGQRLGENRPDLAGQSTRTGFLIAVLLTAIIGIVYIAFPEWMAEVFHGEGGDAPWAVVAGLIPTLLWFVVAYALFDAANVVYSHALRGAGDTRFVSAAAIGLAGPVMVLPAWACWYYGWGLYWAWTFASLYVMLQALLMGLRFWHGRWRSMRVIERTTDKPTEVVQEALAGVGR